MYDPMDIDTPSDTDERTPEERFPGSAFAEQDQRRECLICLGPLEDDKAVFGCGHAKTHMHCAATLTRCPECRRPGSATKLYL